MTFAVYASSSVVLILGEIYRQSGRVREGITYFNQFISEIKSELASLRSEGFKGIERIERTRKLAYAYCYLGLLYTDFGNKASALEQYKV